MFQLSQHSSSSALCITVVLWLTLGLFQVEASVNQTIALQSPSGATLAGILDLIYRQKYNEAITRLEQFLENNPQNGEALTYVVTASLYQNFDFTRAQADFKEAFKAGGGATFFVTHSHEKFSTSDVVDYCRGWLHLRANGVEFVPIEGNHGFKSKYDEVEEIKRNRLSKKVFHIRVGEKNQNFRGRSNTDVEALLIIALFKSFARREGNSP
jgi:tetratricopeptide (TPR) repeat protein